MGSRLAVLVTVHLILERDDKVLLLRRANTGFMDGWLSLPAGHLESGETLLTAAVRELHEEVGLRVKEEEFVLHAIMHRRTHDREYMHTFFRATNWEGVAENVEPEKCDLVGWFPRSPLPDRLIPYVKSALLASPGSALVDGWET